MAELGVDCRLLGLLCKQRLVLSPLLNGMRKNDFTLQGRCLRLVKTFYSEGDEVLAVLPRAVGAHPLRH